MSEISDFLKQILTAYYGKDVRQSIHDAIKQCYEDATGNPESVAKLANSIMAETNERKAADAEERSERKKEVSVERTRVNNIVKQLEQKHVELWSGSLSTVGSSVTLSDDITNYDYIEIYTSGNNSNDTYAKRFEAKNGNFSFSSQNIPDSSHSENFMDMSEMTVSINGNTLTITNGRTVRFLGGTLSTIENDCEGISKVVGIKYDIQGNAEVSDLRIDNDGKEHDSAGDAVRAQVGELKGDIANWTRLNGVVIKDGTDLSPLVIESGEHGYYANNGVITPITYNDFGYFKLPIIGGNTYYLDYDFRWAFTTDSSGNVVDFDNNGNDTFITSENAVLLCVTYNKTQYETRKIAKGSTPTDTIFKLPQNVKVDMYFSDLSGKITSNMIDGYEKGNLKNEMVLVAENKYAYVGSVGANPIYGNCNGCNVYSISVEPDVYTFKESRFVLPLGSNGKAVSVQSQNVKSFDNTELKANKLLFSIVEEISPFNEFIISKGSVLKEKDTYPDWISGATQSEKENISKGIVSKTGSFSAIGDNILLPSARSNLRKGIRLVFEATVTNGADFEIGFSISESSANTYPHNIISVTSENISYNNVNYPHGLSITGRLQMLFEYLSDGTADITLLSNGDSFKQNVVFTMSSVAVPYVKSNGLIATDCKFTFICTDIRKKIWMFGDSYLAYSNERWTYYLKEHGYDTNVLLDGFPGMGSVNGRVSFAKLLNLGMPKIAVWFLGMNSGTDTDDTTPNTEWATYRDDFIALCEANNVEPIFATIPNVPSINHNGKNAWIKSSGYRYIDMCHAVGADVNVNWYGDMLSSDKVHPSESGAKALFAQVLLDLPEVMLDNL